MRAFLQLLLALPAVFAAPAAKPEPLPGSYIFKLQKGVDAEPIIRALFGLLGIEPTHKYSIGDFQGFAMSGVPSIAGLLTQFTGIASIEPNSKVYTAAQVDQAGAPWGLGRISHIAPGATDYLYDSSAGTGTFAYVIDTGIRTTHQDFNGRAIWGTNQISTVTTDDNGHGTHVAGTIGSTTYGVAKNTTLIAVKVLGADGAGTIASVLGGIDWAVNDAKAKNRIGKAVANLSLGGGQSDALNAAVQAATDAGLFVAVAAGNNGQDASTTSPASVPNACTVGATDKSDNLASFSNYGPVVDINAPGVDILSLSNLSDDATETLSGTSMATPHIAGLGAYFFGYPELTVTPAQMCAFMQTFSIKGKVVLSTAAAADGKTTKNLGYNGSGA